MITNLADLIAKMKTQITTKDDQAIKALKTIFSRQNQDEKINGHTYAKNNIGFTAFDAKFLSEMVEVHNHRGLSDKQMVIVKKKIGKYAGQLVRSSINSGKIKKVGKEYVWGNLNK